MCAVVKVSAGADSLAELRPRASLLQMLLSVHSVFDVITPNRMVYQTKLCLILVEDGTESFPHGKSL